MHSGHRTNGPSMTLPSAVTGSSATETNQCAGGRNQRVRLSGSGGTLTSSIVPHAVVPHAHRTGRRRSTVYEAPTESVQLWVMFFSSGLP